MTKAKFEVQLNKIEDIFKKLNLQLERNSHPSYVNCTRSYFKDKTYFEIWKQSIREGMYDFILTDHSFVQFKVNSFRPLDFSYSFYECPFSELPTRDEYLEQELKLSNDKEDELNILRDYELLEPKVKDIITPLRYDYEPSAYKEGSHPAAHMHFGHENSIRVGTVKLLLPISFILFIIRQCYPDYWRKFINLRDANLHCRNVEENLEDINRQFFNTLDNWEMKLK